MVIKPTTRSVLNTNYRASSSICRIAFDQNISKFPAHWRQKGVTIIADITSTIFILASRFRVDGIRSGIHQVSKLGAFPLHVASRSKAA